MSKLDIEKLYVDELAITEPSEIDIEAIAYYKGALVKHRSLKGSEARIIGYGDRAIISVNSGSSYVRKRFSVGHELGHWFKHRGSVGNLCKKEAILSNRASNRKSIAGREKIANEYASELLMPEYLFDEHIRGSKISFDVIQSIKEAFRVSHTAAAIRYVNSCDYPVILACYGRSGRKWYHKSKQVPEYFYPVRSISNLSPGYQQSLLTNNVHQEHEVDADLWVDAAGAENYEVMEVVWPVSSETIMAFVWWKDKSQIIDYDAQDEAIEFKEPAFK